MTTPSIFNRIGRRQACRALAFTSVACVGAQAHATTYNHHWCFNLGNNLVDRDIGEDYGLDTSWIARGVKVKINLQTYYANRTTGCVDFQTTAASNFSVVIYAEARIGANANIFVRAFTDSTAYATWTSNPTDGNLEQWQWIGVTPTCSGTSCTLTMSNTGVTDPVSSMLATAAFVVQNIDGNTVTRLPGPEGFVMINEACEDVSGKGACFTYVSNAPDKVWIPPPIEDNSAQRKFLMAHEIGHWFAAVYTNNAEPEAGKYDIQTNAHHDRCDSQGVVGMHALRSEEYSAGAFAEGFAHYMSTLAFNDHEESDAWFKYYKVFNNGQGGVYNNDLVDVEATATNPSGGPRDWLHNANGCTCSATACEGRGVELDWLRFYWDYRTNPPGVSDPQPTHDDIFEQLVTVSDDHDQSFGLEETHDWLEDAVQSQFAARWNSLANINGADPTP